jgi:predicted DsbA family dithiol-disulfide isomerase
VELGVTGVPYFLINGAWPIPGAQDVDTMLILLRRAWSRLGH